MLLLYKSSWDINLTRLRRFLPQPFRSEFVSTDLGLNRVYLGKKWWHLILPFKFVFKEIIKIGIHTSSFMPEPEINGATGLIRPYGVANPTDMRIRGVTLIGDFVQSCQGKIAIGYGGEMNWDKFPRRRRSLFDDMTDGDSSLLDTIEYNEFVTVRLTDRNDALRLKLLME